MGPKNSTSLHCVDNEGMESIPGGRNATYKAVRSQNVDDLLLLRLHEAPGSDLTLTARRCQDATDACTLSAETLRLSLQELSSPTAPSVGLGTQHRSDLYLLP